MHREHVACGERAGNIQAFRILLVPELTRFQSHKMIVFEWRKKEKHLPHPVSAYPSQFMVRSAAVTLPLVGDRLGDNRAYGMIPFPNFGEFRGVDDFLGVRYSPPG